MAVSCQNAHSKAQPGLHVLYNAVSQLVHHSFMTVVEDHFMKLPEIARRLISHYGAKGACAAGNNWKIDSYDATNVVMAMVWECWKAEENAARFPLCRSVSNCNNAGNCMEAMLGAAFLFLHHQKCLNAIKTSPEVQDQAGRFVRDWGKTCANMVPFLESAISGVEMVCEEFPWIHVTKREYKPELMHTHLQALRLGFCSGLPFHQLQIPVFPWDWLKRFQPQYAEMLLEKGLLFAPNSH